MNIESKFTSQLLNHLLWKTKETVSTAESCTGGNVAAALTSLAGSSAYFKGGIVAYTDECKVKYLNVNQETIDKYTVYSEEVVKEMVKGACEAFGTTYAIAVSGIAGPTGGTADKPVGTIWIAVGTADEIVTSMRSVDEGRERNILYATCEALEMLLKFVESRQAVETE
ncbi:MAG: CinA family protein [Bacteroidales bacterium]|nr:CinA family protein [Bacteroidales bacterium]